MKLPSLDEMVRRTLDLEKRLLADPTRGREELRRLFRGGRMDLIPQDGGFYVARSEILPLVLLTTPPAVVGPGRAERGIAAFSSTTAGFASSALAIRDYRANAWR